MIQIYKTSLTMARFVVFSSIIHQMTTIMSISRWIIMWLPSHVQFKSIFHNQFQAIYLVKIRCNRLIINRKHWLFLSINSIISIHNRWTNDSFNVHNNIDKLWLNLSNDFIIFLLNWKDNVIVLMVNIHQSINFVLFFISLCFGWNDRYEMFV